MSEFEGPIAGAGRADGWGPTAGLPDWGASATIDDGTDVRIAELIAEFASDVAFDATGPPAIGDSPRHDDLTASSQALAEIFETQMRIVQDAVRGSNDVEALSALEIALECRTLENELVERALRRRLKAVAGLQEALGALRRVDSVATMLQAAPREFALASDFDRVNLFRVEKGRMVMESAYWEGDPVGAQEMVEYGQRNPPRLEHMLLETEMTRRRAPCLVRDAPRDPRVPRDLADWSRSRSYVAAPIMPSGKVIGFVHADCLYQGRRCDTFDRDLIWAFAESFGYAFERTVLSERSRAQRHRAKTALVQTVELLDEVENDELRLAGPDYGDDAPTRAVGRLVEPEVPIEAALTRREIEVLRLMATGMTNQAIADELVVTVGTVKAHVKHILKKFRASNRSEVVSRYVRSARDQDLAKVMSG